MATCPHCSASSRTDPQAMTVEPVLVAKRLGTFSVGATPKTVATGRLQLRCRCGWSILGDIEGDSFVGDPDTQSWPEA